MLQAKEQNMHLIYNRAFNATYVGADSQPLCSTAHVNVSGGTFSNCAAVPADLSEASLEDGLIQIRGFQDDKGLFINVKALSLIVPRQEFYNAVRITKSMYQAGSANNDINAIRFTNSLPDGIVDSVYLTSPHAWFIRTDCGGNAENGMIFQERMAPEFNQDNDFDTKNFKAATVERYAGGWGDPRGLYGSNGP
jgi:phage major head subunit gpT-like protein